MSEAACAVAFDRAVHAQRQAVRRRRRAAQRRARQSRRQPIDQGAAAGTRDATRQHDPAGPGNSPTQRRGAWFEALAVHHVQQAGLHCLVRNLRCRTGEIDIVALDGDVIVFIEVRARRAGGHGGAAASVTRAKQARLARAAAFVLPRLQRLPQVAVHTQPGTLPRCRFDVLAFEADRLVWLTHAFCA